MKSKTPLTKEMQNELNAPISLASKILLIVGAVLLGVYIFVGACFEEELLVLEICLYVGAVFVGIGVGLLFLVKRTKKNANLFDVINNYEFFEEYFTIESERNGEIFSTAKIYYKEIHKIKERKTYLFIYHTPATAFPVLKETLSNEELTQIKNLISNAILERKNNIKKK